MFEKLKQYFPILLLTAGHGAVDFYIGLLQVVAPGLAAYLGVPIGDLVLLVGMSILLNNIMQPLAGWIMGRRNISWMLWGAVFLSALPTLMGYATGYWSLAALVLLGAIGTGLYHPEGALSAHEASGDKAHLGVPQFMAGGAGVVAICTPLCIKISERYGFPALAWFAVPGIVVGFLFLFQYRHRKRTHPSLVIRPRSKRVTRIQAGTLAFWPLFGVGLGLGVGSGMFLSLLSSHFELLFGPESRSWSGWVLMVIGFAGSLCSFLWSTLAKKRGFYKISLITQLAAAPLFLLMANPSSPEMGFLIALPLSLVSPNAVYPVAVTMARNTAGLTQGLRTSIMMGGTSGLSSIAVMVAGALIGRGLPSRHLVLFIAFCSVVTVGLSLWQLLARPRVPESVE